MKYIFMLSLTWLLCSCSNQASAPPDVPPPIPTNPIDDSSYLQEVSSINDSFYSDWSYYHDLSSGTNIIGWIFGPTNVATRWSNSQIPQSFADLQAAPLSFPTGVVGVCYYRVNGTRDIIYDREWWSQLSSSQKKELVYHENGHCQLSRAHRCGDINGLNYKSIMYPSLHSNAQLTINIPALQPGYYGDSTIHYLELEFFAKTSQNISDCPTSTISSKLTNSRGDIAQPDTYEELFTP